MKLLRHSPLTFWVVVAVFLGGLIVAALLISPDEAGPTELSAAPTEEDRQHVLQLRNRLGTLMQLARDDDASHAGNFAHELSVEARSRSRSRQARVGPDDDLVKAYQVFSDEAAKVRSADDVTAAVDRVLAAADLMVAAAFGGDSMTPPPGFGGNLEPGDPAGLGDAPRLPSEVDLHSPDRPVAPPVSPDAPGRRSITPTTPPALDEPVLPHLEMPDLPEVTYPEPEATEPPGDDVAPEVAEESDTSSPPGSQEDELTDTELIPGPEGEEADLDLPDLDVAPAPEQP